MKYIWSFLLFLFIFPAGAGKFPVVTSITTSYPSPTAAIYAITSRGYYEVGPSVDVPANNGWYIVLGHRHFPGDLFGAAHDYPQYFITTNSSKTVSEWGKNAYDKTMSITQIPHSGEKSPQGQECVGYGYAPASVGDYSSFTFPAGCLNVPPADQWCKITTPEIVLDHGTITLKQAEGDVASTSMSVQCTVATAVTFNLITDDKYIYLDEGKSEITVDNQPLNSKINLPQGDSQMPVKDLLTGITSEGFHTGSSVLVMMPY